MAAAGNEGPASMTTASPGSANTAITVGAAANPVNTRVFWEYRYRIEGIGYYLYTSAMPQIYAFSSRGPTADGRLKPTVSATGIFVLSAYPTVKVPHGLAFASGTSMSTPAVSGAVALINSYAEKEIPESSPEDYRQAITSGAVWLDGYTERDQGAGYLNAYYALEALKADESLGDVAPELPPYGWLEPIANIPIVEAGTYEASIEDLKPGHKVEYIFYVTHLTDTIRLDLTDVYLGIENPLGWNSFEVYIQSAKRTMYAYYIDSANVWGDASFLVTDYETTWTGEVTGVYWDDYTRLAPIEPGYVKIIIENDWTSYDALSADIIITVTATTEIPSPSVIREGVIGQDEATPWMHVEVPKGTEKAIIQLTWLFDWSMYPTTDLDLYVYWDEGYNYNGATLNSPERVILEKPTYLDVLIHGYAIYTGFKEPFILTIWFIK
ncbi:MAG: S8 family serine peptidase [Candidatus Bathyarchaeia archaeon]|nr:S8 family serine peptidase [Candidatus Bathyarchaeia archaeon]